MPQSCSDVAVAYILSIAVRVELPHLSSSAIATLDAARGDAALHERPVQLDTGFWLLWHSFYPHDGRAHDGGRQDYGNVTCRQLTSSIQFQQLRWSVDAFWVCAWAWSMAVIRTGQPLP